MTNKEIDNISYLDALRLLQTRKVKNLHEIVKNNEVKKYAREILRNDKKLCNKN